MNFNDAIKSVVAEAVYHAWEMEQSMNFLTPKDKESLRRAERLLFYHPVFPPI